MLMGSLGATSYIAYRIVGFLGQGIIGVIALTVEMERSGPVGHGQASSLYAQQGPLWSECLQRREPNGVLK
jgi:hypothetical protein